MKYIETFKEGEKVKGVYLCKKRISATTKAGKQYEILLLQDKTGTVDAKIWNPGTPAFDDFAPMDYISVLGEVTTFLGSLQFNLLRATKALDNTFDPSDYMPTSEFPIEDMFSQLMQIMDSVKNPYLQQLLKSFFVDDKEFVTEFKVHSAAKSVHHGFRGGLLEHTLGVTKLADTFSTNYPILNRDLLVTGAILHDIGKVEELSQMPENDYTDVGNLLGHLVIGSEMIGNRIKTIEGFPKELGLELQHCILSHHGELEYGSPKKPELAEAVALHFADNVDASMETVKELLRAEPQSGNWMGYQKLFDSNFRKTTTGEK
ncbi:MAG: HD domain-containing protein [Spirochaetia bacterium]|jgi:3'-5' exoribonuclease|nr:HD domain-containing protein [Spirochaetia bacterium]